MELAGAAAQPRGPRALLLAAPCWLRWEGGDWAWLLGSHPRTPGGPAGRVPGCCTDRQLGSPVLVGWWLAGGGDGEPLYACLQQHCTRQDARLSSLPCPATCTSCMSCRLATSRHRRQQQQTAAMPPPTSPSCSRHSFSIRAAPLPDDFCGWLSTGPRSTARISFSSPRGGLASTC